MAEASAAGSAPAPPGSRGIDEILAEARCRLHRLDVEATVRARAEGAVLVDIRPAAQRAAYGEIPGTLIVERNHLEWRFDPRCDARLTIAGAYDLPVIVFCQEGYTSSLAAAALQEIGLFRATDLIGGFAAWAAAGRETVLGAPTKAETTVAVPEPAEAAATVSGRVPAGRR